MGRQNRELLKNIERYEQEKKAKQQKSKVLAKGQTRRTKNKNRVLMCTTHHGCKVYGIWYENE